MAPKLTFRSAEDCLRLTVEAMDDVVKTAKDKEFLERALRTYGDMRVSEFCDRLEKTARAA